MDKKFTDLIERYEFGDVNLLLVRNKNEKRVIEAMRRILPVEFAQYTPNALDIQDIYALALNGLAPRYIQQGSIVLREPVKLDEVADVVREAVQTVMNRPNYTPDD